MTEERRAWRVVTAMQDELKRQHMIADLRILSGPDDLGRVLVSGHIDLAALAAKTEEAMGEAFASDRA